ncbi:MAG: excinuclease ABC subunit UvrB [Bdellovibrionaceae bacterium]|nr:excinuclease ABC subunit UvrB [Pseudobdellovibrionaceae bacterium]
MNTKNKSFELKSKFKPQGDQPKAIKQIFNNFQNKIKNQTLLGVTGSGKTFTMAHVIAKIKEPALILAPNKTLAAQLFVEFKELFPNNAVEYFVSYYDYYQPEAYIPATNTYIEKESSINEQIDLMRHSATRSLLDRKDVIIVSSISCIYGIGSPNQYKDLIVALEKNQSLSIDELLKSLVDIQYKRDNMDFYRGVFRCRGDIVEIFPAYEDSQAIRIEFFGDYIDSIKLFDPITGHIIREILLCKIYPANHYVTTKERTLQAIKSIREELRKHLKILEKEKKLEERGRLQQRTIYDLEMLREMGTCPGVENYSRHLTRRKSGEPPPTLLEYFPKKFLTFIDESHISIPQAGGMYRGDRRRKSTLVEHGFRLPSALDNRPLNFEEFEKSLDKTLFVSATPGDYELKKSSAIIEQIIRPTGLLDPEVFVRPAKNQIEDLLKEIKKRIKRNERVLITTLTKKMAEKLTSYYQSLDIKTQYLHSDIKTLKRTEILGDLRAGVFDVLIGINLLREGLDLPEVSLVAILDSDKEGFLRSERSLIQTIGRTARNAQGKVILYGDQITYSMQKAINETNRRRKIQTSYNKKHNIKPKTIKKVLQKGLAEIYGLDSNLSQKYNLELSSEKEIVKKIQELKKEMQSSAQEMDFEKAAKLRDQIKNLELKELELSSFS